MIELKCGDCLEIIKQIKDNSIDLVVTSPPYDNLRNYKNTCVWNLEVFKKIADEIYKKIKPGAVIIWVVADKTEKGSETGTSFNQALYFKKIGLNLHDTMIYRKLNYTPLTHNRYEQEFEYIFVFSKGKPKTFNPIRVPCKYAGTSTWGKPSYYKTADDRLSPKPKSIVNDTKIKGNIFEYKTGSVKTGKIKHPAMFPLDLAVDQIKSWSNEGDLVIDPFMGSGTTGLACKKLNRNFIGIEIVKEYYEISKQRIEEGI